MDYEKAYKAVLKTATQWIKDGCTDKERICLESVFPELRESEDERIRKELIEYLTHRAEVTGFINEDKDCKRWISYLEKQKEPIDPFDTKLFQDGVKEGRRLEREEMKKEQKPIEITPNQFDGITYGMKGYSSEKPAEWSEEDEETLEKLHRLLVICRGEKKFIQEADYNKMDNFLKSLRPRSRKELSIEKAIQWLDDTFYFLDNSSGRGRDCEITTHDFDSLEEMYDSFRKAVIVDSEPSWKPSKEQMESLYNAVVRCRACSNTVHLPELYEDLKTL